MTLNISGDIDITGTINLNVAPGMGPTIVTPYGIAYLMAKRHSLEESPGTPVSSLADMTVLGGAANLQFVTAANADFTNMRNNPNSRLFVTNDIFEILFTSWEFGALEAEPKMVSKPSTFNFINIGFFHWELNYTPYIGLDVDACGWGPGLNPGNEYAPVLGYNTSARLSTADSGWETIDTGNPYVYNDAGYYRFNDADAIGINPTHLGTAYYWISNP